MTLAKKFSPFYNLLLFYVVVSFVTRVILLLHPITQSTFHAVEIIKIVGLGLLSDFFIFVLLSGFLWLYLLFISNAKYYRPYGYVILTLLLVLLLYLSFANTILNEYGSAVPAISILFVAVKTILFALLLFLPKYRSTIRFYLFSFAIFLYVILILQNAISEYFFWNEFGVKYNFIAVNYLVYTNEVIGNIMQSYPVAAILSALTIIAGFISYLIVKRSRSYVDSIPTFVQKIQISAVYLALFFLSFLAIPILAAQENSHNIFVNELESNGLYKFFLAFKNSELDYNTFYKTIPKTEAYTILKKQVPDILEESTLHLVGNNGVENHKNVILITIESLSASFMKTYGNEQNITPFLDSLARQSLLFTNCYAAGNRTVRGLEALTLCIPPTAGESVIKRKDNKGKFSTGSIFKNKGYKINFIYGGDARFDNMGDFFSGNGYRIIDKKTFSSNEITFSNVWGVCDEDIYKKVIKVVNAAAETKKPFFNHIMTVSNHRPFTYPNGTIDIPGDTKSRDGGVKYTDFALRKFFEMARKQSWFANTVFVIVADHCASSAGKTELPVDKYRIPAMIYSPGFVKPMQYDQLMSQIDVMPTLFGILNFSYESKFYGQDVFESSYKPRALIATYQDLGLIKNTILTVLSPKQSVKQFQLTLKNNLNLGNTIPIYYEQSPLFKMRKDLINETISYYQTASDILKEKKYQELR